AAAILREDQHADAANVPLPAAKLLMESGIADDFSVHQRKQGQVAAQINVLAPLADGLGLGHAMFDEHAFGFRHGEKKFMKGLLVVLSKWPQPAPGAILKFNFSGILLKFKFQ